MAKNEPEHHRRRQNRVCDDRSGFLMVHVRVGIFVFELAQGLIAMVGENNQIGVLVHVLQDRAKDLSNATYWLGKALAGRY